ncbi:tripartite tricarboxylate transporter substrate binding protein [Achromobacter animicus]|uniref:Bug family tripartite tricarboxylate transporter substrate binding protein n=1 Tax=Achromobacter animicus TaxID=1389935 RepID=UPI0028AC8A78|nr:tripartite tricarboxylate transporter substrate binding protein [Achromobacter animicus]
MQWERRFWSALFGAAVLCSAQAGAANTFPDRPVRLIVPQSAGSGGDVVARLLGEKIGSALGQPIVVENRPGANGIIAASFVAKAPADGYTLMLAGVSQMSFNPRLYKSLAYQADKDFTYVSPVVDTPFLLVASKNSGIKSLKDLQAAAKAKPGTLSFASAGAGNSTHLSTEMIAEAAGIKLMHVPFKGSGPALNAVLGGQVDLMTSVLGAALPQVAAGNLVPLAVLADSRAPDLPDVPTLREAGIQAPVMPGWFAVVGPAAMDEAVVSKLNAAVQASLADNAIQERLRALYLVPIPGTAQGIAQRAASDADVWGAFIQRAGVQAQ